jgi:hypothetical protein
MAFPAGRLPNAGELQTMAMIQRPGKSVVFTHATSDLDLTDPANKLTPCATQFEVTAAGILIARLAGDTADRTYPTAAIGTIITGLFVVIRSTSTCDGLAQQ